MLRRRRYRTSPSAGWSLDAWIASGVQDQRGAAVFAPADEWDDFLPVAEEIVPGISVPDLD